MSSPKTKNQMSREGLSRIVGERVESESRTSQDGDKSATPVVRAAQPGVQSPYLLINKAKI